MAYLIQRKNGWWYIEYKDGGGNRKRVATGTKSKTEAKEALGEYITKEAQGYVAPKACTLKELADKYINYVEGRFSERWAHNKKLIIENFLIPYFGESTPIKSIEAADIEAYQKERLKGVSRRTTNVDVHHTLLPMLNKAVEWGLLEKTPKVEKLREPEGRLRFLNEDEVFELRRITDILAFEGKPEMDAFVMLALHAGLRAGEAVSLLWTDINFETNSLTIEGKRSKTGRTRVVPLSKRLREYLAEHKANQEENEKVLGITYESLKKRFKRVVIKAGLPVTGDDKVTAHTLRHTFASRLVMNGTPLFTVAKLMGHSDTKTTEIYAHLAPNHLTEHMKNLDF